MPVRRCRSSPRAARQTTPFEEERAGAFHAAAAGRQQQRPFLRR